MRQVPVTVKSSLFFPGDTPFARVQEEEPLAHARRVLEARFHSLKTAVVNHLAGLKGIAGASD
jgi:hypothetical protein